jgi:hypothetical protein
MQENQESPSIKIHIDDVYQELNVTTSTEEKDDGEKCTCCNYGCSA